MVKNNLLLQNDSGENTHLSFRIAVNGYDYAVTVFDHKALKWDKQATFPQFSPFYGRHYLIQGECDSQRCSVKYNEKTADILNKDLVVRLLNAICPE